MGPSPRGRGNRQQELRIHPAVGSIPAWAGKPARPPRRRRMAQVHPRVGGETKTTSADSAETSGPSPRGRGNQENSGKHAPALGSIPAWAGKPRWACISRCQGPSPRGRGNHLSDVVTSVVEGSIPAWAGKPWSEYGSACPSEVHPRVGGETASSTSMSRRSLGPSPRGRGNLVIGGNLTLSQRSIPAWAGKP